MDEIHWRQALTVNMVHIHPKMIDNGGMVLIRNCQLKGQSPRTHLPEERIVKFDTDFVVDKIRGILQQFCEHGTEAEKQQIVEIVATILGIELTSSEKEKASPSAVLNEVVLYSYDQLIEARLFSHRKLRTMRLGGDKAVDYQGNTWERQPRRKDGSDGATVFYKCLGAGDNV